MELIVKHFSELSAEELFEIYKLRVSVFIVEQSCPYQDIADADKSAYHVWLRDEDGIEAYARVLPAGVAFPTAAIGRVIAVNVDYEENLRSGRGMAVMLKRNRTSDYLQVIKGDSTLKPHITVGQVSKDRTFDARGLY